MKEGDWQGPARGHSVVLSGLSGRKQNLPALPSGWRCGPEPMTLPFHHEIYMPHDNQLALVIPFPWPFFELESYEASSGLNAVASCCVGM